jgi:hypothetical protein
MPTETTETHAQARSLAACADEAAVRMIRDAFALASASPGDYPATCRALRKSAAAVAEIEAAAADLAALREYAEAKRLGARQCQPELPLTAAELAISRAIVARTAVEP